MLLNILVQGPVIRTLDIGINSGGYDSVLTLNDHRARITCMRLFFLFLILFGQTHEVNERLLSDGGWTWVF